MDLLSTSRVRIWRNFDFVLVGVTFLLIIYGILMIRSATLGAVDTDLISRVPRQIEYAAIGIVVMFITAAIDYRLLGALHQYIYGLLVFVLGLMAVLGECGAEGHQGWLPARLPVQTSESAEYTR